MIRVLKAEDEFVLEPAKDAIQMQVGLVHEVIDVLPALVSAERGGRCTRIGRIHAEYAGARAGDDVAVVCLAIAGQVGDAGVLIELVAQADGEDVDVRTEEVLALGVDRHVLGGFAIGHGTDQKAPHVGIVIGVEAVVIEGQVELVGRQPQAGQCHTLALAIGRGAIGDFLVAIEQVGTHGEVCVDDLIGV